MPAADWIAAVNGVLLLALTVKAFWGWVFGREHSEAALDQRCRTLEQGLVALNDTLDRLSDTLDRRTIERRKREHSLSNAIQAQEVEIAVLRQRVEHLEEP